MGKTDRCVVRNKAYRKAGLGIRERHNERKNSGYANTDIDRARAALNVHFKRCEGSYAEAFERMVENGTISTRGLKQDAKVVDEMVFDVNSAYFERNGGYAYAKRFFEEAYRLAVKEAGGEEYILSAVMHADERNRALSEQLGRDIYHYHLHVVYVPVVEKEVKWTKRCKDPALVGTTKEVIHQVSHSKKWASEKALDKEGNIQRDENGKALLINAYSLLQDRFFEHMQAAGFKDFERGERGSTAAHLGVLEYKIKQDKERLAGLAGDVADKEEQAAALDKTLKQKGKQLAGLDKQLTVTEKASAMYSELERMGKKNLWGHMELLPEEFKKLLTLAKSGLASQGKLLELQRQLTEAVKGLEIYRTRWQDLKGRTKDYMELERLHPEQTRKALESLKRLEKETSAPAPTLNRKQQQER